MNVIKPAFNIALSQLKMRSYHKNIGVLNYDDCIGLALYTDGVLKDMTPFDPAYEHMVISRQTYWRYATDLAVVNELDRTDHMWSVSVIYSKENQVEEALVWLPLPRNGTPNCSHNLNQIKAAIINHHKWFNANVDIVIN